MAVELRRGARELRSEVLHQVLDEVALAEQQVALDVRAVLAQPVPGGWLGLGLGSGLGLALGLGSG